jgi:hypothetical protein
MFVTCHSSQIPEDYIGMLDGLLAKAWHIQLSLFSYKGLMRCLLTPRCKLLIALQLFLWENIHRSGHPHQVRWRCHYSHLSSQEAPSAVSKALQKPTGRLLLRMASSSIYWIKRPYPPGCLTGVIAVFSPLRQRLRNKPDDASYE